MNLTRSRQQSPSTPPPAYSLTSPSPPPPPQYTASALTTFPPIAEDAPPAQTFLGSASRKLRAYFINIVLKVFGGTYPRVRDEERRMNRLA
ncbi:hypothetical protein B0H10DRAFT_2209653 [Mycena sp. CBHHK59/15]|nr:hypothetical protein B0H10DRAFT_2209653 [Mycena sp. CBHHK59/15]